MTQFVLNLMFYVFLIPPISGSCDPKTEYTIKNMTSGEFLRCKRVDPCRPGSEPLIPVGSDVDIHVSVGHCCWCKNGTYSEGGIEPCKECRYTKCFEHQRKKSTCPSRENRDESYCIEDECEEGYIMNARRTVCELEETPNNPTGVTTPATSNTPITPIARTITPSKTDLVATFLTTKKTNKNHSSINAGEITGIVFGVFGFIGLIGTFMVCYFRKRRENVPLVFVNDKNVDYNVGTPRDIINVQGPPSAITSMKVSNQQQTVVNEKLVDLDLPQKPHVPNSPDFILDALPYETCEKIYETFDTDTSVMNWRNLAAWLGLKVKDVRRIERLGSNFTRNVIQTWETQTGNDIDKFIGILRKESITKLADEIQAARSGQAT